MSVDKGWDKPLHFLENASDALHLAIYITNAEQDAMWRDKLFVQECDNPKAWRLAVEDEKDHPTTKEFTFTVYGALAAHDLLPVTVSKRMRDSGKYQYLKQSVKIDGLGSEAFERAMAAGDLILDHFDRSFPEGKLEKGAFDSTTQDGERQTIDISNRIFTPDKDCGPDDDHVSFGRDCDPVGAMQRICKLGFRRIEDNHVAFSEGRIDMLGALRTDGRLQLTAGVAMSGQAGSGLKRKARVAALEDESSSNPHGPGKSEEHATGGAMQLV
ncbi:hypothetical protein H0H93_005901 [Arthromyces matolae]|nr:hypothetical protein H0H93_005901 [Arthromyces matolae]